jgi:Coenzyme PQQ synthesis protein D (PqqD)
LWRTAPGYLVVGTVDGRTLEVEGPGGDLWTRLDGWIAEEELISDLARDYGADADVVSADVHSLLHELHTRGYVDRHG